MLFCDNILLVLVLGLGQPLKAESVFVCTSHSVAQNTGVDPA